MDVALESGAEIVLSGIGGDDLFDGDPRYFADQVLRGEISSAVFGAMRLEGYTSAATKRRRLWDFLARSLLGHIEPSASQRLRRRRHNARRWPWAGPKLRAFLESRPATRRGFQRDPSERFAHLASAPYLTDISDARGQLEVETGLTRVDPFLDDHLGEFVFRLPPELLLYGDRLRGLFREAMRGLLPESIRLRTTKADFEPALTEIVAAAGGFSCLDDLVEMTELGRLGLVNPLRFKEEFCALIADPGWGPRWSSLWPALSAEAFARGLS
jgi:asparagine synthase (glutamine-hydrolysing)